MMIKEEKVLEGNNKDKNKLFLQILGPKSGALKYNQILIDSQPSETMICTPRGFI